MAAQQENSSLSSANTAIHFISGSKRGQVLLNSLPGKFYHAIAYHALTQKELKNVPLLHVHFSANEWARRLTPSRPLWQRGSDFEGAAFSTDICCRVRRALKKVGRWGCGGQAALFRERRPSGRAV